ncbi:MAG: hypothetical protein HXY49_09595 [Ignavibacteriaceae bacterium]|nr:hypothetical protein [Ignavibacteriaceae bacterium]
MLNKLKTYRVLIAAFVISGYLALFAANIFHFHKTDLFNQNHFLSEGNDNNVKNQYSLLHSNDIKCVLHNNFISINSFFQDSELDDGLLFICCPIFLKKSEDFVYNINISQTFLRAPPLNQSA